MKKTFEKEENMYPRWWLMEWLMEWWRPGTRYTVLICDSWGHWGQLMLNYELLKFIWISDFLAGNLWCKYWNKEVLTLSLLVWSAERFNLGLRGVFAFLHWCFLLFFVPHVVKLDTGYCNLLTFMSFASVFFLEFDQQIPNSQLGLFCLSFFRRQKQGLDTTCNQRQWAVKNIHHFFQSRSGC